jgi:hypothetical protein
MKLYIDIKNEVRDESGIEHPQKYLWGKVYESGPNYPIRELSEDDIHEEIRNFIDKNNLPQISLDEIPTHGLNSQQLEYIDFFNNLLN